MDKFLSDTLLDEDRTMLSKKVLIILAFVFGLSPHEIRDLKLNDLYKKSGNLYLRLNQNPDGIAHNKIINFDVFFQFP